MVSSGSDGEMVRGGFFFAFWLLVVETLLVVLCRLLWMWLSSVLSHARTTTSSHIVGFALPHLILTRRRLELLNCFRLNC